MQEITIRPFRMQDRQQVRDIAWETAFMGEPADRFFSHKDILEDFLTGYFTDYNPYASFVAETEGNVAGYLLGAVDARNVQTVFFSRIAAGLLAKLFMCGALLVRKNRLLFWRCFVSFLKREFAVPDFSRQYPATLHINIRKEFRGEGMGARLIRKYLSFLKEKKVAGVHFATMSPGGHDFFLHEGFTVLYQGKRSYFKHLIGREMPLYIFGMKL